MPFFENSSAMFSGGAGELVGGVDVADLDPNWSIAVLPNIGVSGQGFSSAEKEN